MIRNPSMRRHDLSPFIPIYDRRFRGRMVEEIAALRDRAGGLRVGRAGALTWQRPSDGGSRTARFVVRADRTSHLEPAIHHGIPELVDAFGVLKEDKDQWRPR
jgi:hypothetical protein